MLTGLVLWSWMIAGFPWCLGVICLESVLTAPGPTGRLYRPSPGRSSTRPRLRSRSPREPASPSRTPRMPSRRRPGTAACRAIARSRQLGASAKSLHPNDPVLEHYGLDTTTLPVTGTACAHARRPRRLSIHRRYTDPLNRDPTADSITALRGSPSPDVHAPVRVDGQSASPPWGKYSSGTATRR
jgi:hypothetical protein